MFILPFPTKHIVRVAPVSIFEDQQSDRVSSSAAASPGRVTIANAPRARAPNILLRLICFSPDAQPAQDRVSPGPGTTTVAYSAAAIHRVSPKRPKDPIGSRASGRGEKCPSDHRNGCDRPDHEDVRLLKRGDSSS